MSKKSFVNSVVQVPQTDFALIARAVQVLNSRPKHGGFIVKLPGNCYEAACRADPEVRVDDDGTVWVHEGALFSYLNRVCQDVR